MSVDWHKVASSLLIIPRGELRSISHPSSAVSVWLLPATITSFSYLVSFSWQWCHRCFLVWRCLWDVRFSDVILVPRSHRSRGNALLSLLFHFFLHGSMGFTNVFLFFITSFPPLLEFRQEYMGRLGWMTNLNSKLVFLYKLSLHLTQLDFFPKSELFP